MDRFEVVPTMRGAEVYDNETGRTVEPEINPQAARALAARLNAAVARAKRPQDAARALLVSYES